MRRKSALMKNAGIPIGEVYSSQLFRAVEWARLLTGRTPQAITDITGGGLVVSSNENARRAAAFRKLVARMPPGGRNNIIVSHKPNLMDAFGKDWFDTREGEASVFKPGADGKAMLVTKLQNRTVGGALEVAVRASR